MNEIRHYILERPLQEAEDELAKFGFSLFEMLFVLGVISPIKWMTSLFSGSKPAEVKKIAKKNPQVRKLLSTKSDKAKKKLKSNKKLQKKVLKFSDDLSKTSSKPEGKSRLDAEMKLGLAAEALNLALG